MDFRRNIVWILFIVSGLFLLDSWQRHEGHAGFLTGQPPSSIQAHQMVKGGVDSIPAPMAIANPASSSNSVPTTEPLKPALPPVSVLKLTSNVLALEIATHGGNIVRAELLKHKEDHDISKNIVLLNNDDKPYWAQTGLSGKVNEQDLPNHTPNSIFSVITHTANTLVLESTLQGVTLRKTIQLKPDSYEIAVNHQVINQSVQAITPSLYLQLVHHSMPPKTGNMFTQPISTFTGAALYTDEGKYQKIAFDDIEKNKANFTPNVKEKESSWIAMVQHYFVSAWVAKNTHPRTLSVTPITHADGKRLYRITTLQSLGNIAVGATVSNDSVLYVGPQDQGALAELAQGLELVVDYGMFTIFAKPMFWLLKLWHNLTGNWGWAIILLTLTVKAILYLPMAMSDRSMARMKNLAPKLQALKERYNKPEDRMKLSAETMALYRTEKVNPLSGCLPIFLTIPVFMALYWVLLSSVEMRHAPFEGWIVNLALPDPYYVLPVLLLITMVAQFKMSPAPADPTQAKMMLIMQGVFGILFAFFPSGLNIYYFVNNVVSIAQKWWIAKQLEREGLQINLSSNDKSFNSNKINISKKWKK